MTGRSEQPQLQGWMRPFLLGIKPPDRPVTRVAARRFVRSLMARTLLLTIPAWIVAIVITRAAWIVILAVVMTAVGIGELIYLSIAIARSERGAES
jgi:CBS domain containing-hemolysin-like protein